MTTQQPEETSSSPTANEPHLKSAITLKFMLLIAGIVGAISTFILVMEKLAILKDSSHKTSCDLSPFISCGSVMASWQASLFGFPNQFIGIVAFTTVLITAFLLFLKVQLPKSYWIALYTGTTLGFILIIWLWSQSLYSIGALCLYCIAVWSVMIPLWILMTRHVSNLGYLGNFFKNKIGGFLNEWWWVLVIALYLGVVVSIFFRFQFYWLTFF